MIRIVLPALLVAFFAASGCAKSSAKKEASDSAQAVEFKDLWPQEDVAKLSAEQRRDLLDQALVGLRGNNWQHAQDVLVRRGRAAVPALIDLVPSKEPSAASAGPIPNAKVKSLGELAHDTLLLIVQNRSGYRGQMPERSVDAWKRWWSANSAGVAS
jgi:hypothetical protein